MIKIFPESTVYIFCPAHVATGGPEALHQMGHALTQLGIKVNMVYYNQETENPVHINYAGFGLPYGEEIQVHESNLILLPETYPRPAFDPVYKKIRKVIWWLSVTNYYISLDLFKKSIAHKKFYILKSAINPAKYPPIPTISAIRKKDIQHIAHSYFSKEHLLSLGIEPVGKISDYMNPAFFSRIDTSVDKEDIVIFNPKKNGAYLDSVIQLAPDIRFIPLTDMTPVEVATWMNKSKLYIDFGYHPGQERMPREAILTNCCVITGSQGSAKYHEDVPLPAGYKFNEEIASPEEVVKQIRRCMTNYQTEIVKFKEYRAVLLVEQQTFESAVANTFIQTKHND